MLRLLFCLRLRIFFGIVWREHGNEQHQQHDSKEKKDAGIDQFFHVNHKNFCF